MCSALDHCPFGFRRVSRPYVRRKRIYAFAADRYAEAQTPSAVKFWEGVMDCCIGARVSYEEVPGVFEAIEAAVRRTRR